MSGPIVVLRCTSPGCTEEWHDTQDLHWPAVRRARIAGWNSVSNAHGCLCADADVMCPTHATTTRPGDVRGTDHTKETGDE